MRKAKENIDVYFQGKFHPVPGRQSEYRGSFIISEHPSNPDLKLLEHGLSLGIFIFDFSNKIKILRHFSVV